MKRYKVTAILLCKEVIELPAKNIKDAIKQVLELFEGSDDELNDPDDWEIEELKDE